MPFPQMGNNPKEKACILIGHAPLSSASMGKMFTTRALLQIHITGAAAGAAAIQKFPTAASRNVSATTFLASSLSLTPAISHNYFGSRVKKGEKTVIIARQHVRINKNLQRR